MDYSMVEADGFSRPVYHDNHGDSISTEQDIEIS
jgi:hypothetical protein